MAEGAREIRLPVGKGIAGTVAATGDIINIPAAYQENSQQLRMWLDDMTSLEHSQDTVLGIVEGILEIEPDDPRLQAIQASMLLALERVEEAEALAPRALRGEREPAATRVAAASPGVRWPQRATLPSSLKLVMEVSRE